MISVKEIRKRKGLPEEIPKPIQRTPEEIEQAQAEGQAYIQEREKIASKLGGTLGAQREAARQITAATPSPPEIQIARKLEEEAAKKIETTQLLEQQAPPIIPLKQPEPLPTNEEKRQRANELLFKFAKGEATEEEKNEVISNFGKGLGIAAGVGAAVLGGAALMGGLTTASTIGATTVATGKFAISTRTITGLGGGAILIYRKASEAKNILTSSLGEMDEIIKDVEAGRMSYAVAQHYFADIMQNIVTVESSTKTMSSIDVFQFLGLKDTMTDFQKARDVTIPSLIQQLDEARLKNAAITYGQ